jgi:pyruvate/2-oxoglutarate dehydrogenase complex dihydrolipoamide acyltransferase (E2) component
MQSVDLPPGSTVLSWKVKKAAFVKKSQILCEYTLPDGTTGALESPSTGIIGMILVQERELVSERSV